MPGMDGTGPLGRGPMTGWGLGRCAGGRRGVAAGFGPGAGFGRGGRLRRNRYYATGLTGRERWAETPAAETEAAAADDRLARIEARLDDALGRLDHLEKAE